MSSENKILLILEVCGFNNCEIPLTAADTCESNSRGCPKKDKRTAKTSPLGASMLKKETLAGSLREQVNKFAVKIGNAHHVLLRILASNLSSKKYEPMY